MTPDRSETSGSRNSFHVAQTADYFDAEKRPKFPALGLSEL
jgi:hypothetical protein